mmetsp:Transcript_29253/g.56685  ORF Transcript_29253/g.56685 Transcript_29253/m.56685 type:complete len:363 (-) Transcript_29253:1864-2952(-)
MVCRFTLPRTGQRSNRNRRFDGCHHMIDAGVQDGFVLAFGHDADQRFGARFADQEAPVARQLCVGLGDSGLYAVHLQRGLTGGKTYIFEQLWYRIKDMQHFAGPLARLHQFREELQTRHQPVAGGGVIRHDHMARLFAPEVEAALPHPLHHIAVAHTGSLKAHVVALQKPLKPEVRHDGGHQRTALEPPLGRPARRHQPHELITVPDPALFIKQNHPVGIAIKANAHIRAMGHDRLGGGLRVGRSAAFVDVVPIGGHAHRNDRRPKFPQRFGCHAVGGPIGAIQHNLEPIQAHLTREGGFYPFHITISAIIDVFGATDIRGLDRINPGQHQMLDLGLCRIAEFEPVGAKKLDPIVSGGVVAG